MRRSGYGTDNPKSYAHFMAGAEYYRMGNLELAETEYSEAIEGDPRYAHALNNRALIYLTWANRHFAKKKFQEASTKYEKAISDLASAAGPPSVMFRFLYNLATAYSYYGRLLKELLVTLDIGQEWRAAQKQEYQRLSIQAYEDALGQIEQSTEIEESVKSKRKKFVQVAKACSLVQDEPNENEKEEAQGLVQDVENHLDNIFVEKPDKSKIVYSLACYYALATKADDARNKLQEALRLNPSFEAGVADDPDLQSLRNDSGLQYLWRRTMVKFYAALLDDSGETYTYANRLDKTGPDGNHSEAGNICDFTPGDPGIPQATRRKQEFETPTLIRTCRLRDGSPKRVYLFVEKAPQV